MKRLLTLIFFALLTPVAALACPNAYLPGQVTEIQPIDRFRSTQLSYQVQVSGGINLANCAGWGNVAAYLDSSPDVFVGFSGDTRAGDSLDYWMEGGTCPLDQYVVYATNLTDRSSYWGNPGQSNLIVNLYNGVRVFVGTTTGADCGTVTLHIRYYGT